jgi:hypothetical protein
LSTNYPIREAVLRKSPEKVYVTGRKCAAGFKKTMKIAFD